MRGKIDLIYIDPPYDSKADYRTKIILPSISDPSKIDNLEQKPTVLEQFAYGDTWCDGTASYLKMITPRLVLMRELLSDKGSIYVHIDWHVGHYVKLILDEVFGRENFVNEVIWAYRTGGSSKGNWSQKHDNIYFYKKSITHIFNTQLEKAYTKSKSRKAGIVNYGAGNAEFFEDENGVYNLVNARDIWEISYINSQSSERTGYSTQKPVELLERIIKASSNEDSVVADFFCGSGTTAAVAEKLGRKWITTDLGKPACMITRKRLIDNNAKPFLYQHVGDYQIEQMRQSMGRKFRIGDLSEIVLGLYGALPLNVDDNPNRNLGRIPNSKILVYCDSPNKITGYKTIKHALDLRNAHIGGWDKVIVLGWNFASELPSDLTALNDKNLEILVIPPDLLDRIKKKGKKLRSDEVKFSSLQYLLLGDVVRDIKSDTENLTIPLSNYVLLSPDALNIDEKEREKITYFINNEPLALIEYWSVDPDYDGKIFRSLWQDYRGNTDNDNDPLRVITTAHLDKLPIKHGKRTICVRAVDIFGFEAEAIIEV